MVQGVERLMHLVVVKEGEPVMDISRARRIIQGAFIQGDRTQKIAIGAFVLGVLDDLGTARSDHSVAAAGGKAENGRKDDVFQERLHYGLTSRMKSPDLTPRHRFSLRAIIGWRQILFLLAAVSAVTAALGGQLREGNNYSLSFTDVDGRQHATANGHVTVITVMTRRDEVKADTLGERVTHVTLGDPKFELINLVNFQQNVLPPLRGMVSAM